MTQGPELVRVTVSAAQARQRFHGCTPGYIKEVCKAACCRSTTHPQGIMVAIHSSEEAALEARGATVQAGLLQPRPGERRCPFQGEADHLCGLHFTPDKPFGCIASPFTLSPTGRRLVVRNRYRLLRCYRDDRDGPAPPAYRAFRASLDLLLGREEAARLCAHLDAGGGDLEVAMPAAHYQRLLENAHTRQEARP